MMFLDDPKKFLKETAWIFLSSRPALVLLGVIPERFPERIRERTSEKKLSSESFPG